MKSFIDFIIFFGVVILNKGKKYIYIVLNNKSPNTLWIIIEDYYEELCVLIFFLLFHIWVQILIVIKGPFYGFLFYLYHLEVKYAESLHSLMQTD